jgi:hypothetical protein
METLCDSQSRNQEIPRCLRSGQPARRNQVDRKPIFKRRDLVGSLPRLTGIRKTTPQEAKQMRAYSHSRITDIATCPTWGVVHAQKQYKMTRRAMALEAGALMHQMFAAVRIWQLEHVQGLPDHAKATAQRLFGLSRWKQIERIQSEIDTREGLARSCL